MPMPDLDHLLTATAAGDEKAFQELYKSAAPQLLAIARRMLGDPSQAEDVLQQTMITAWNSAGEYDPQRAAATTWLTSIIRNNAIDHIRRHGRREAVMSDDRHDILATLGQDADAGPDEPLSQKVEQRILHCFGKINREHAGCIQLAYLDGLTFPEIAEQVQRSLGTVKSWVRRGMQKLRECIER